MSPTHGSETDYFYVLRTLMDLEEDQAIVKDVLFVQNQGIWRSKSN
jgi:hypothetical protein